MNLNFRLAALISLINTASIARLEVLEIAYCNLYVRILQVLYLNGIINSFYVKRDIIKIKFKYRMGNPVFQRLQIVSKPGNRRWVTLSTLSLLNYNTNISGFHIISTPKGFLTDSDCLIKERVAGEILILVSI